MKLLRIFFIQLFFILIVCTTQAQRGHEIQLQVGSYANWGVLFYDYNETESRRHRYEFDYNYNTPFFSFSWHYPVNAYLDLGVYFSRSSPRSCSPSGVRNSSTMRRPSSSCPIGLCAEPARTAAASRPSAISARVVAGRLSQSHWRIR